MTTIAYTTTRSEAALLSETDAKTVAEALTAKGHTNVEAIPSGFGSRWIVQQSMFDGTRRAVTYEHADEILCAHTARFEVGKMYRSTHAFSDNVFLVTKVTRSDRRTRYGGRVPNDWVTFKIGFERDGVFHPYDHQGRNSIRRKIQSNRFDRTHDEWCYERPEESGVRFRIETLSEVQVQQVAGGHR